MRERQYKSRGKLAGSLTGAWLLALCCGDASLNADEIVRRGLGPEPDSLDIHQAQGLAAINLLRDLREGLVTYSAAGDLVPGVAQSWEVSADRRTYRFSLRPDARWSGGDPVIAGDFVRGLRRAVNPATVAATAGLLKPIKNAVQILEGRAERDSLGIVAVSDHLIELELQQPTPWFLEVLAHPVTYPIHSGAENPREQAVNGAYELVEWTPHANLTLARNGAFHSAATVQSASIVYYPIEEPSAELSRYRAGELDITETIPAGRYQWLTEHLAAELRVNPYLGSFWLNINLQHAQLGASAKLRRALALAVNREILTGVVIGAGEAPAYSLVPPGLPGYQASAMPEANLSQEEREAKARALFAELGLAKPGSLRLELRYNTSGAHRRTAVAVAAMWKQVLGVETELVNEEWKVFVNNRKLGIVTQVFRGGWIADYADPSSFLDLFESDNEMNFTFYRSDGYDDLLAQARLSSGEDRAALLHSAESRLLEDMPAIPLYYYVSRHLVKPDIKGFVDNVRDIHLSRYLSREPN